MGKKILKIYDNIAVFENNTNNDKDKNNHVTSNYLIALQNQSSPHELHSTGSKSSISFSLEVYNNRNEIPMKYNHLYSNLFQTISFDAIYGFYELLSTTYIALVIESESFITLNNIIIRKALKIIIIPLFHHSKVLQEPKVIDENKYLELLYLGFKEHAFYYSISYDVTLSQQSIAKLNNNKQSHDALWKRADKRFFWNYEVLSYLTALSTIKNHNIDDWIVPFMSAYIEIAHECITDNHKFALLFISRRSCLRQGCRFTKRGIDSNGNVGNFVETEQIIIFPNGKINSFVQIRGSIPISWSSIVSMKYAPKVYINPNIKVSQDYAEKHFREVLNIYSNDKEESELICINLIDMKKDELLLGNAYKETVNSMKTKILNKQIHFIWFDFHAECKKNGKWKNLSKLVSNVNEYFHKLSYFSKASTGEILSYQIGIIRTNCMDNLDRTNVVQSLFARRSLILQLGDLIMISDLNKYILDTPWKSFEKTYKSIWVNNANAISKAYAGTGALKTDFTKTGKRTITGMFNDGINSCMRYYYNNFTDGIKQDAIDLLIGNYHIDRNRPSPFISRLGYESLFTCVIKLFTFMVILFSSLVLLTPRDLFRYFAKTIEIDYMDYITLQLIFSISITLVFTMYLIYVVVKKGSKIGEKIVVHPRLLPETHANVLATMK